MDVVSVKEILSSPLSIPQYQRPYKWAASHVNQLLDDVIKHKHKKSYRLGTVVLHKDKDQPNILSIVDGQQRLLTLTLICHFLKTSHLVSIQLLEHSFDSNISKENLQHNAAIISSRLNQLTEAETEELTDFLFHKCELIEVVLDDLNEAFQFFDSQNSRGKELEPYDLLKAFHLREMELNTESERLSCVEKWEENVDPTCESISLRRVMGDYLFRMRNWAMRDSGKEFTREHIGIFKGVNLHQNPYPFTSSMRALNYQVEQYNHDPVREWDLQEMAYPFSVDQPMVNGRHFFEYIQRYIGLYNQLFLYPKKELIGLMVIINGYEGRSRKGDHYVRNLFLCSVMFYYDKFGDAELSKAARLCFLWSYRIRLELNRVAIESIDNHAKARGELFDVIKRALHPYDVLSFPIEPVANVNGTKIDGLTAAFKKYGALNNE
jgi:hypothetical protein